MKEGRADRDLRFLGLDRTDGGGQMRTPPCRAIQPSMYARLRPLHRPVWPTARRNGTPLWSVGWGAMESPPFGRLSRFCRTFSVLESRRPDYVPVERWQNAVEAAQAFFATWPNNPNPPAR